MKYDTIDNDLYPIEINRISQAEKNEEMFFNVTIPKRLEKHTGI